MAGALIREEDIPADIRAMSMEIDGRTRHLVTPCNGASGIISPNGDMLAGPVLDEEVILTAKANLGTVMMQKMIADHAGHYTRPDVFDFRVNARPKRVSVFEGRESMPSPLQSISLGVTDGSIRTDSELALAIADVERELAAMTAEDSN
jgi:hypothetical protein